MSLYFAYFFIMPPCVGIVGTRRRCAVEFDGLVRAGIEEPDRFLDRLYHDTNAARDRVKKEIADMEHG